MSAIRNRHSRPGSADWSYWVVSPNVRNHEKTVAEWIEASVRHHAAFMGWSPDDQVHKQIGPKFAGETERGVKEGDVILIARRHNRKPQIVGFGVVKGESSTSIRGLKLPEEGCESLRHLSPFRVWRQPPSGIPLMDAIKQITALARLHPESNDAHKKVCKWMEQKLGDEPGSGSPEPPPDVTTKEKEVDQPGSHQLDYEVRTEGRVIRAKKIEAKLLNDYQRWLMQQDRKLVLAKYGRLQCDGYEEGPGNLIEAKASASREHVRMAVGQLLDYAFVGREKLGDPHKAILLPERPERQIEDWLRHENIGVIWREGEMFFDNANGQFA